MSPVVVTLAYGAAVVVAFLLLYFFGARRWYWHVLSVTVAIVLGLIPMRVFEPWLSPLFDLTFGSLIVFLLLWGSGAPLFRHAHRPVHHH